MPQLQALPISHRSVLTVAVPIMLSNVSEPLIGVVNTAVIGQLPEPYYIGAVTVGSLIFSFIFWGFGFLRLSTGGMSAQAVGAGDGVALVSVLVRAMMVAIIVGLLLLALSPWIEHYALNFMGGTRQVRREAEIYFELRIWSAPFALINYVMIGWFIGQGRAKLAFLIQVFLNATNMALSLLFVLHLGMATEGVGLAVLIAEIVAAALGLAVACGLLSRMKAGIDWRHILDRAMFWRTIAVNANIMVRTLCLVFAFTWFTSRGARSGDIILAANVILLHFFDMAAFLIDGFAYASETLVGQAVGARNRQRFRAAIWLTSIWAMALGVICTLIIWLAGPSVIDLMTVSPDVQATARVYLPWAAVSPVLGVIAFQFDGIFTGALATADMRNMMIVSLAVFMAAWWLLEARYGNHGLWAALNIFFVARGITFASRMPSLEKRAFQAV